MATTYKCAYCGSQQTYDGSGARVCQHCGATQPEKNSSGSLTTPAVPKARTWPWVVIAVLLTGLVGAVLLGHHINSTSGGTRADGPAPIVKTRLVVVNSPQVRVVDAGSDLSVLDLLRSSPANQATLFPTQNLTPTQLRPMKDIDGKLYYVGEVTNRSATEVAIAPTLEVSVLKGTKTIESTELNFSDLPPGASSPAFFSWDGNTTDFNHIVFRWKPVQGYPAAEPRHPRLTTTITDKKLTPGTVEINFTYTYHYTNAEVKGTVTNRGDATAKGMQLYLTLHDAQGRVTGFKEKDMASMAPGETVSYDIDADQWDAPIASIDVTAFAATPILVK